MFILKHRAVIKFQKCLILLLLLLRCQNSTQQLNEQCHIERTMIQCFLFSLTANSIFLRIFPSAFSQESALIFELQHKGEFLYRDLYGEVGYQCTQARYRFFDTNLSISQLISV